MIRKVYNRLIGKKYRFKEWFFENITPHLPKIPTRKPEYPGMVDVCVICETDIIIYAYHTGDGWLFYWDCEEQHVSNFASDGGIVVGYFPFVFGWATAGDLEKIGIEVW